MTLRVLQSFDEQAAPRNPYMAQLVRSLTTVGADVRTFDWRLALRADYDVLHLHWPENLLQGRGALYNWRRRAALLALLRRCRRDGIAIVRTLHNEQPHEVASSVDRRILDLVDAQTDGWIALNPATAVPLGGEATLIPHGHYISWYRDHEVCHRVPGRLLFFGLLRRYKAVPGLLTAFAELGGDSISLRVCGKAKDADLQAELEGLAARDPRVGLRLERVSDADLAREIGQAELVVLPYAEMHNSGAVLLALSLGRPVLVPASRIAQELADEVGAGWVLQYEAPLDAAALARALEQAREIDQSAAPDLSGRDWDLAGELHLAVYDQAVQRRRDASAQR